MVASMGMLMISRMRQRRVVRGQLSREDWTTRHLLGIFLGFKTSPCCVGHCTDRTSCAVIYSNEDRHPPVTVNVTAQVFDFPCRPAVHAVWLTTCPKRIACTWP